MNGKPKAAWSVAKITKVATATLYIGLIVAGGVFLGCTHHGHVILQDPKKAVLHAHLGVHKFTRAHPLIAPIAYLLVYVVFAALALPIWWLQFFAGVTFGLYEGTFLSVVGSTCAVAVAVSFVRWVAGDWFHQRVESHMDRLKKLDETLGHNGFLFVMTARLIPLIPFGLFNYALGLSKISYRDIILGTFLGAIPLVTVHVALGAGYNPENWRFDLVITGLTLLLLTPLILRYLKPSWFEKIGVE
jgi:uncharacterized membrane protein YdjX (TVP38/TMEM64 family)